MILLVFNFNKCCIWIIHECEQFAKTHDLTLTSVVFEFEPIFLSSSMAFNLTLTSVVFELWKEYLSTLTILHLTLTSVVFELVNGVVQQF